MTVVTDLPVCDRPVTGHEANACNKGLVILADPAGAGNASHQYFVHAGPETPMQSDSTRFYTTVNFQNGPIQESGINGITNEALLAIVADRLRGFQSGPYAGRENALALTKIEEALHWLHHRTRQREARGVEGTSKL